MRQRALDINARESLEEKATPHGMVGVVHAGRDLKAWWIDKHGDEIERQWLVFDREDLLYVIEGQLRLEFPDAPESPIVLSAGECYAVPPGRYFKGFSWPRANGVRCLFLAVSAGDTQSQREVS